MRHALILPVPLLDEWGEFTPVPKGEPRIHLCLSHLMDPRFGLQEQYIGYYREARELGDYLIMDNGADESKIGQGQDVEQVLHAARLVRAQEIVLPDVQEDAKATCHHTREGLEWLRTYEGRQMWRSAGCPRFMIVPQGRSLSEWIGCAEALLEKARMVLGYIDGPSLVVGVAKQYHEMFKTNPGNRLKPGRVKLVEWLHGALREHEEVHLLGYPRGYHDIEKIEEAVPGFVRSVDSAKPVVYALNGMYVDPFKKRSMPDYPRRPRGYFERKEVDPDVLEFNLRAFTRV